MAKDYAALAASLTELLKEPTGSRTAEFTNSSLVQVVASLVEPDTPPTETQVEDLLRGLQACAELAINKLKALTAVKLTAAATAAPVAPAAAPPAEPEPSPALPYVDALMKMTSANVSLWTGISTTLTAPPAYGSAAATRPMTRATCDALLAQLCEDLAGKMGCTDAALGCLDAPSLSDSELVEAVLQLTVNLSEAHRSLYGASALLSGVSRHLARQIVEIRGASLKQAQAQQLLVVTQRLQLLTSSKASDAAADAFSAVVPPRIALLAKALSSSTLTLKLWAVKDAAQLITQARLAGAHVTTCVTAI